MKENPFEYIEKREVVERNEKTGVTIEDGWDTLDWAWKRYVIYKERILLERTSPQSQRYVVGDENEIQLYFNGLITGMSIRDFESEADEIMKEMPKR